MAQIHNLQNLSSQSKSSFILTFVFEVLDTDLWQDIDDGWLELGACIQTLKMQYQLYINKTFEINIFIWPQVAKIVCGPHHTWVRTWLFLERRWLAFSIKHAFPVLVDDLKQFNGLISIVPGSEHKNEKAPEVFLPELKFGDRRYFAPVQEEEPTLEEFVEDLVLKPLFQKIPEAILEGPFDMPFNVSDVRHQDALIYEVREMILNQPPKSERSKQNQKMKKNETKLKIEIRLPGELILAGLGRVISFTDEAHSDLGEVVVFLSTGNLPTSSDLPIFFVNIEKIFNIPLDVLSKYRITHIYTQWKYENEIHKSKPVPVNGDIINIKDHCAISLTRIVGSQLVASFMESPFEIEIQAIREVTIENKPQLFNASESLNNREIPRNTDTNISLAVCKINLKSLCKQRNGFISGEFPVDPVDNKISNSTRQFICTNDINNIKTEFVTPIIPSFMIVEAQMTMEVSVGLCGCRLKLRPEYGRVYCLISTNDAVYIINMINEFNKRNYDKITGWAINIGNEFIFFAEGITNEDFGYIFNTIKDLDNTKIFFDEKETFYSRIYFELLSSDVNFLVLKMLVPMKILLSKPSAYVKPTLPIPAKTALLKLGRLLDYKLETPFNDVMPTVAELRSFRIELCTLEIPIQASKYFDLKTTNSCTANLTDTGLLE